MPRFDFLSLPFVCFLSFALAVLLHTLTHAKLRALIFAFFVVSFLFLPLNRLHLCLHALWDLPTGSRLVTFAAPVGLAAVAAMISQDFSFFFPPSAL